MNIAILQGAFLPIPPIQGGAVEKRWYALGVEFAKKGHEVTHISRTMGDLPAIEYINQVRHIRIRGYDMPKSSLFLKLLDLLYTLRVCKVFANDYDIIVSNTFWAPIVLPKKARRVCMVDVARMPKGQMWLYRGAAYLRANSSSVANAIRRELPEAYHSKVIMIPNPLPFTPLSEAILADKKNVMLYTGRIHPEKGLDLLIEAYTQTNQQYKLQIVGPWEVAAGGGGKSYVEALRRKAAGAPIEFVGPVYDTEKLNGLYASASIFIYPSIAEQGETFGLAPLEAMAWGCVPIVSNLDCFRDFIEDGVNGLVFNHRTGNAISQLTSCMINLQVNIPLRKQLAVNAMNVRSTHSTTHIADLFLKGFEQLVNPTKYAK